MDVFKLVFIFLFSTGRCWNEVIGNCGGIGDKFGGTGGGIGGGRGGGGACWPVLPGGQNFPLLNDGAISYKNQSFIVKAIQEASVYELFVWETLVDCDSCSVSIGVHLTSQMKVVVAAAVGWVKASVISSVDLNMRWNVNHASKSAMETIGACILLVYFLLSSYLFFSYVLKS